MGAAAKGWIVVAALSGAISVAVGAFAAHGLDLSTEAGRKAREWLQTGSQYQIIHALAIMGVVVLARSAMVNAPVALVAQCLFLGRQRALSRRPVRARLRWPAMDGGGGADRWRRLHPGLGEPGVSRR